MELRAGERQQLGVHTSSRMLPRNARRLRIDCRTRSTSIGAQEEMSRPQGCALGVVGVALPAVCPVMAAASTLSRRRLGGDSGWRSSRFTDKRSCGFYARLGVLCPPGACPVTELIRVLWV